MPLRTSEFVSVLTALHQVLDRPCPDDAPNGWISVLSACRRDLIAGLMTVDEARWLVSAAVADGAVRLPCKTM